MPEILGPDDRLEVIFDGPSPGTPDPIRVRVRMNGIDLGGEGLIQHSWWERVGANGWQVSVICAPKGHPDNPIKAYVPMHSPAEFCDCPNPRPGKPFHCAVGGASC
jgi:hypothetical protein